MINVVSYIKIGEEFVTIDDPRATVEDPYYIEGAIELDVDGVVLFNQAMWDLVDQLWDYVVQGLESIEKGKPFKIFFPDQPLDIVFTHLYDDMIKISVDEGQYTVVVDRKEFAKSILGSVKPLLNFIAEKSPSNKEGCDDTVQRLEALVQK